MSVVVQKYGGSSVADTDKIRAIAEGIIERKKDEGYVVVVTAFKGITDEGYITILGRGGSDTSAVALAVKLNGKCEIYTDVDGVYFTDPRAYAEAKKLEIRR